MLITQMGSVGMGLVWGWLLVLFGGRLPIKRPFLTFFLLLLATALAAYQLFRLTDFTHLILFLATTCAALLFHFMWRESLQKHRSQTNN